MKFTPAALICTRASFGFGDGIGRSRQSEHFRPTDSEKLEWLACSLHRLCTRSDQMHYLSAWLVNTNHNAKGVVVINKRRVLSALALVLTISLAQPMLGQKKSSASDSIKIPFETYKLPNGLTVILSVDRTTPTVAVNVWYHVGSKNEMPGRTGFAHLFEHVMFTGSGHVPYGLHDKLTEGVGGGNNGSTSNDRTNYYETIPVQLSRNGVMDGIRSHGIPAR